MIDNYLPDGLVYMVKPYKGEVLMKSSSSIKIPLSHVDKLLFPESHITKKDVIEYYTNVAHFFIDRAYYHPLVMQRFPQGIKQAGFYQKQISDYFPSWLSRKTILLKKGEKQTLVMVNKQSDLVYLANQNVLVFHSWLSTGQAINYPDKLVFDLDPSGNGLKDIRYIARQLRAVLQAYNLDSFVMTTGSRSYHLVVPLVQKHTFNKVHEFAKQVAHEMVGRFPQYCTVQMKIAKREGKIFIDYLRNAYGQTSVACYSLRALPGAPIATPLSWDELSRTDPQKYTIKNIFKRLACKPDPWKDFEKKRKRLPYSSSVNS